MKSNFYRVVSLVIVVLVLALSLCGCGENKMPFEEHETFSISDRFVCISEQEEAFNTSYYIYVDRKTRVMYLAQGGGVYTSGMTAILNADGTPELYDGDL